MFGAALTVRLIVRDISREDLELLFHELGFALMERQGKMSSLLDHSVAIDLGEGVIEISVTTAARSEREAQALADFYVKDVLRSTGGHYIGGAAAEPVFSDEAEAFAGVEVTSRMLVSV